MENQNTTASDPLAPAANRAPAGDMKQCGIGMPVSRRARLSTGVKLFLILVLALLPLAIIAVLATKQISRLADDERDQLIAEAIVQSGERLQDALQGDQQKLNGILSNLIQGTTAAEACKNLGLIVDDRKFPRYAIVALAGSSPRANCISNNMPKDIRVRLMLALDSGPSNTPIILPEQRSLLIKTSGALDTHQIIAYYPAEALLAMAAPGSEIPASSLQLADASNVLRITEIPKRLERFQHKKQGKYIAAPQQVLGMNFGLTIARQLPNSPEFIALILPAITILAAAFIAWYVADRLLIRPVVALRQNVSEYEPGEELSPLSKMPNAAAEIEQLGDAFRDMSVNVSEDKSALAEALVHQKLLTREVHHRVKNNVQVISSLIRIHARGASSAEEEQAFAFMQRRVDALAVVQRNHFAEVEDNEGISLRTLANELIASLRTNARDGSIAHTIKSDIANLAICQDIGVPVAFLITEIAELSIKIDPDAVITIAAIADDQDEDAALLSITSPALTNNDELQALLGHGVERILTGLSRQLRSPLDFDAATGGYSIRVCRLKGSNSLT